MNEGSSVRIGGVNNFMILSRDKTGRRDSGRGMSVWSLLVELHAEGLTARRASGSAPTASRNH
jgi:hypothetical protein